ncbi:MAG: UbiX family flavin prenyltransferase [Candidatus Methanofastidiosa archaeon]|jgi:4-hydroxy-3-polyprenylbenzoate decarboxylase|nr:UbiX family flavin prenyltransferase [Candidatus Methanofastidiosa archaeon]
MEGILAITGASGVIYGIRLLENLKGKVNLVISEGAKKIIEDETEYKVDNLYKYAYKVYKNTEIGAPIASGSYPFSFMIICPASISTISKISVGIQDNLITRAAAVALKEKRKLIIVPRETPLTSINLRSMANLSDDGAVILPAMPAFYHNPKDVDGIINFIVGRILDQVDIENNLFKRWGT